MIPYLHTRTNCESVVVHSSSPLKSNQDSEGFIYHVVPVSRAGGGTPASARLGFLGTVALLLLF